MSSASADLGYRAADAPLTGVVIAPSTERTSERTPHRPYIPNPDKRRKGTPGGHEHDEAESRHPGDDGHLVDDYA